MPAGTTVGHVHLRVTELPGTVAWYRDVLGLVLVRDPSGNPLLLAAAAA